MTTFRPFTDADYPALADLWQLVWDEPRSADGLLAADAAFPNGALRTRLVAEQDGRPVLIGGYSETPWSPAPGKYFLSCFVHPAYQGRGLGRAWYTHITTELARREARLLTATARHDQPAAVGFLTRRGFRETIQEPESRLDVASFDPQLFAPQAQPDGISILPLPALPRLLPDWKHRLWELEGALWQDVPTSEAFAGESFDAFHERVTDDDFYAEGYVVALDTQRQQLVGMTHAFPSDGDPRVWECGLTGVVRSHRRRGIALALKLRAITGAAAAGATTIVTNNEERNPMYALNVRLGFRYTCTWLGFERVVEA